jgi:hypothetical protein
MKRFEVVKDKEHAHVAEPRQLPHEVAGFVEFQLLKGTEAKSHTLGAVCEHRYR